ncbi:MAG: nucleotidyltransferase family protein [Candidatus Aenigmatarchaeota archaeon]|nr:nucleotidyltransferase family protein [Candidatus Aenigmarchaeota archaeon]
MVDKMGEVKTAVVLVGGAGLRMYPLTENKPKCMIEIAGKPILFWVLNWLKSNGIKNVVVGVAYKKEIVVNYLKNNNFGLNIAISEHSVEGETGEGFRLAIERYVNDENFIAMNGDELTNINLSKMIKHHLRSGAIATLAVSPLKSPFGIVELWEDNIVGFKEKPIITDKFVSSGIYVFNKKIKDYLPLNGAIEKTTFPRLAEMGVLKAYKMSSNERWATVNTVKDLQKAEEELKLMGFIEKFGESR